MSHPPTLHVDADGRSLKIDLDTSADQRLISDILRRHDLPLNTRCGQRGLCDGCIIELTGGTLRRRDDGQCVTANDHPIRVRGCEYQPAAHAPIHLRIPARSLLSHRPAVLDAFEVRIPCAHAPIFDASGDELAIAIDLGTTTVVAALIDLSDDRILKRASAFNRQIDHGADVLTRINHCLTDTTMLDQLQRAVLDGTIAPLMAELLTDDSLPDKRLAGMVIAGNTTMLHLLAGVDPSSMGVAPFTAAFLDHQSRTTAELKLSIPNDSAKPADARVPKPIHLLPSAAAYIGADVVAGVLASGLAYDDGPALLIDVGTNGEIVLKHKGKLIACATAAGPAFEGAGLKHGARATDGAISHVRLPNSNGQIELDRIGRADIHGLCGSAYIDFLSEARRRDVLTPTGRFNGAAANAFELIRDDDYGHAFVLATNQSGEPIGITEADIARLLQAKAAIAAGILTLLTRAGLNPPDLRKVYLAGGFGMHLNIENAIGCGLLPGIEPAQVELVGNTSLAGAYLATIDRGALDELTRIAGNIEIVELNLDPDFEGTYIDQLALP